MTLPRDDEDTSEYSLEGSQDGFKRGTVRMTDPTSGPKVISVGRTNIGDEIDAIDVEVSLPEEDLDLSRDRKRTTWIEFPTYSRDDFALDIYSNLVATHGIKQDYLVQREDGGSEWVDSPSDVDIQEETGEVSVLSDSENEGSEVYLLLNRNENRFGIQYGKDVTLGEQSLGIKEYVEALHANPEVRKKSNLAENKTRSKVELLTRELENELYEQSILEQARDYFSELRNSL